jgi:RHS repeat-associated protein
MVRRTRRHRQCSYRQSHLPFGEDFAESSEQQKHHFTSYERDPESGLDYAINRSYQPLTGRFVQADPYRASGYIVAPQSWNRYRYSRNDPINLTDPLGLNEAAPPGSWSVDVYGGMGTISASTPFFAYFWASLTGGGSGGSSNSGGEIGGGSEVSPPEQQDIGGQFSEEQQKQVDEIKNKLKDLFKNEECAKALGGKKKALELLNRAQVRYANTINPKYAGTGGKAPGGARRARKDALDYTLAISEIGAPGILATNIYINSRFFTDIGPSSQLTVFIHELSRLNGYDSKSGEDEYAKITKACGTADPNGPRK